MTAEAQRSRIQWHMPDDKSNIRDAGDAVRGALEAVPVYEDALQPAARQVGQTLETVAKAVDVAVKVALSPVFALVWSGETIRDWLLPALDQRLRDVPADQIIPPPINVAGPVIEALRFAGSDETLRELYANLLATAMDSATTTDAHPAFVEMLKQMTPDEARLVSHFSTGALLPFIDVDVRTKPPDGGGFANVVGRARMGQLSLIAEDARCADPDRIVRYLDNLERLGLIARRAGQFYLEPEVYERLMEDDPLAEIAAEIEAGDNNLVGAPILIKGHVEVTALGGQFIESCVLEHGAERWTSPYSADTLPGRVD